MKIFNIYNRDYKASDIKILPSICHSSTSPYFFSLLWLIKQGAWKISLAITLLVILLSYYGTLYQIPIGLILLSAHFLIAFISGHLVELSYRLQNYKLIDIICARDEDEAMIMFMKRMPISNI